MSVLSPKCHSNFTENDSSADTVLRDNQYTWNKTALGCNIVFFFFSFLFRFHFIGGCAIVTSKLREKCTL